MLVSTPPLPIPGAYPPVEADMTNTLTSSSRPVMDGPLSANVIRTTNITTPTTSAASSTVETSATDNANTNTDHLVIPPYSGPRKPLEDDIQKKKKNKWGFEIYGYPLYRPSTIPAPSAPVQLPSLTRSYTQPTPKAPMDWRRPISLAESSVQGVDETTKQKESKAKKENWFKVQWYNCKERCVDCCDNTQCECQIGFGVGFDF